MTKVFNKFTQISLRWITLCGFLFNACNESIFESNKNKCKDNETKGEFRCEPSSNFLNNCIDPDLNKVSSKVEFTNCSGELVRGLRNFENCNSDLQTNCLTSEKFPSGDISSIDSENISYGKSVVGITGSLRQIKRCNNYADLSIYDSNNPPANIDGSGLTFTPASVNTGTDVITLSSNIGLYQNLPVKITSTGTMPSPLVSGQTYYVDAVTTTTLRLFSAPNGSVIDITTQGTGTHRFFEVGDGVTQSWETLTDFVSGLSRYPADNPWGSDKFKCDQTNFKKVSTNAAPLKPSGLIPTNGSQAFTEIWQDNLTGLMFTNVLYRGSGSNQWLQMIEICKSLDNQSAGSGWRIPTMKELAHIYVNGAGNLSDLSWSIGEFITSTKYSSNILYTGYLEEGSIQDASSKNAISATSLFCVR